MAWDGSLRNSTDSFGRSWSRDLRDLALLHRVSPRGLRPKRSSQGFPLNVRVPATRRVPLAGGVTGTWRSMGTRSGQATPARTPADVRRTVPSQARDRAACREAHAHPPARGMVHRAAQ
jgi:hypothetical protein